MILWTIIILIKDCFMFYVYFFSNWFVCFLSAFEKIILFRPHIFQKFFLKIIFLFCNCVFFVNQIDLFFKYTTNKNSFRFFLCELSRVIWHIFSLFLLLTLLVEKKFIVINLQLLSHLIQNNFSFQIINKQNEAIN